MIQHIDLAALERRSWRSYQQDGLFDLYFGALMIAAFIGMVAGNLTVLIALQLAALIAFQVAKRRITTPRMGTVRFGTERRKKKRRTSALMAVSVVVTAALVAFTASRVDSQGMSLAERNIMVIGFGFWLLVIFAVAAYWMDRPRLFTVACAIVLSLWVAMFLDTPVGFLLAGAAFLTVGAFGLNRFLRRYPVESRERTDG